METMDKLPSLPKGSSLDAAVNPPGEGSAKPPAGGEKGEFPRLLAEAPTARREGAVDAAKDSEDRSAALPAADAGGKDLPPGESHDPVAASAAESVAQEVVLPPGLLWTPQPGTPGMPQLAAVEHGAIQASGALRHAAGMFSAVSLEGLGDGPGVPEPEGFAQQPLASAGQASTPALGAAMPRLLSALGGGAPQASALGASGLNESALPANVPNANVPNANVLNANVLNANAVNTGVLDAQLPLGMELDASLNEKLGLDAAASGVRLGLATAAEALSAPRASPVPGAIEIPVGRPGWDQELGARVLWVVRDQLQHAELRLNPPNLGPLEVRLSLQSDQSINLSFSASQLQARDAVEAAIPRLREMLAESGVNLGDVNVSSQSDWRSRGNPDFHRAGAQDQGGGADTADNSVMAPVVLGQGLVDFFA